MAVFTIGVSVCRRELPSSFISSPSGHKFSDYKFSFFSSEINSEMKLTASLLLPLIKASTPRNCNLSGTGIFDAVGYGTDRFVYNIDYRIKTSGRLHNKGKVKQSVAELEHQHYDTSESKYTGKQRR